MERRRRERGLRPGDSSWRVEVECRTGGANSRVEDGEGRSGMGVELRGVGLRGGRTSRGRTSGEWGVSNIDVSNFVGRSSKIDRGSN